MSSNNISTSSSAYLPTSPTVYILRGVSGSGKSSITRTIIQSLSSPSSSGTASTADTNINHLVTVCSADNYFMIDGVYHMDLSKIKDAHAWCEQQFLQALESCIPIIILDNTNTQLWNYSKYEEILLTHNFEMEAGLHPFPHFENIGNSDINRSSSSSTSSASTSSSITATTEIHPQLYALKIVEIQCPDAATLYLFNSRQVHGVPWETSVRQWTVWENDPRSIKISPFIDPIKDQPVIEYARTLPIVIAAQETKNRPPVHPTNNNHTNRPYNNNVDYNNNSYNRNRKNSTSSTNSNNNNNSRRNSHDNNNHHRNNNYTKYNNNAMQQESDGWQTTGRRNNNNNYRNNNNNAYSESSSSTSTTNTIYNNKNIITTSSATNFGIQSIQTLAPKVIQRINYLGFFLKEESRQLLYEKFQIPPEFTNQFGSHVTVAFLPTPDECSYELTQCIGCDVQLQVYAYARNKQIMACAVRWPRKTVPIRTSNNDNTNTDDINDNTNEIKDNDDDLMDNNVDGEAENDTNDGDDNDDTHDNTMEEEKIEVIWDNVNEGKSSDIIDTNFIGLPDKNGYYNYILQNFLSHISINGISRNDVPHVSLAALPKVLPQKSNNLLAQKYRLKKNFPPFPIVARFGAKVSISGGYQVIATQQTWKTWYDNKYKELYNTDK